MSTNVRSDGAPGSHRADGPTAGTSTAGAPAEDVISTPEEMEQARGSAYKWIALSNTTLGVLMVTINASILLIALPDIFRGINLNPLLPGNTGYLLWLIMGFLVVTAVLVVSFGRVGDMYGRVRMYNLGFAVFTLFSILLSVTWMHGSSGAMWLIVMRVLQGIGGALLFANSSAILTDAFPEHQRGLALGINSVAAIAGSFLGLLIGGLLAPVNWRLVFLVSVPFGLFGTVWAYLKLQDTGERRRERIDWWGNVTFAVGLIAVLAGITYGIQPYGSHTMGWTNPYVLTAIIGGLAVLVAFVVIETRVSQPMFRLQLFRIRAFTAGNAASLLAALGRGGLQFILIIWLQGIWLPLHGYSFESTPLWAGIYMIPLTIGFLASAPISGYLSDHFGARPFATGGMIIAALSFLLLLLLPVNFNYWAFAAILLLNGIGMGLFSSPNRAGIMNSLPPRQRGVGGGMAATFQNSAQVLSIGIFFSLIILGLASTLSGALLHGLTGAGVNPADASRAAALPPVATLFASLLGYNPIQQLLGPAANHLAPNQLQYVTGRSFFPNLISEPFHHGLQIAFLFAIIACLVAAAASYLRGGKYHYVEGAEQGAVVATGGAGRGADTASDTLEISPEQPSQPRPETPSPAEPEAVEADEPAHAEAGESASAEAQDDSGDLGLFDAAEPVHASMTEPVHVDAAEPVHAEFHEPVLDDAAGYADDGLVPATNGAAPTPPATPSATPTATPDGPRPDYTVSGQVHVDGVPVPGAVVTLTDVSGGQVARIRTNPEGRYYLIGPGTGVYVLVLSGTTVRPLAELVQLHGVPVEVDLAATASTGSVAGRLLDERDAAPIAGGTVVLTTAGQVTGRATSEDDGGFVIGGVPVGEHVLTAAARGGQPRATVVRLRAGGSIDLDLPVPAPSRVRGLVRAATDGRPLREARVRLLDRRGHEIASTATDAEGYYDFAGVPQGDYVVSATGYEPVEQRVAVAPGSTTSADVLLGDSATVEIDGSDAVYPHGSDAVAAPGADSARGRWTS